MNDWMGLKDGRLKPLYEYEHEHEHVYEIGYG